MWTFTPVLLIILFSNFSVAQSQSANAQRQNELCRIRIQEFDSEFQRVLAEIRSDRHLDLYHQTHTLLNSTRALLEQDGVDTLTRIKTETLRLKAIELIGATLLRVDPRVSNPRAFRRANLEMMLQTSLTVSQLTDSIQRLASEQRERERRLHELFPEETVWTHFLERHPFRPGAGVEEAERWARAGMLAGEWEQTEASIAERRAQIAQINLFEDHVDHHGRWRYFGSIDTQRCRAFLSEYSSEFPGVGTTDCQDVARAVTVLHQRINGLGLRAVAVIREISQDLRSAFSIDSVLGESHFRDDQANITGLLLTRYHPENGVLEICESALLPSRPRILSVSGTQVCGRVNLILSSEEITLERGWVPASLRSENGLSFSTNGPGGALGSSFSQQMRYITDTQLRMESLHSEDQQTSCVDSSGQNIVRN